MHKQFLLTGFMALAKASPLVPRQELDIDAFIAAGPAPIMTAPIAATPTIVTLDPTSLASQAAAAVTMDDFIPATTALPTPTMNKRYVNNTIIANNPCSTRPPQPLGSGPVPSPDTPSAFLSYSYFSSVASAAPTPTGYTNVFTNLQAENNAAGYLGYTVLDTYDTNVCAQKCSAIYGCNAFNIAFERSPTVDPEYVGCTNPASTTNIKCVFWGSPVTPQNAVNNGQWRANFQVVVAGSNGYISNSFPSVPGYVGPTYLNNVAINAPRDCNNQNTNIGSLTWNDGLFDVQRCGAACSAKSATNIANPPKDGSAPQLCQFYNTYVLMHNGNTESQICTLYSQTWGKSYATNDGQWRGPSDHYTIAMSVTYYNGSMAGGCAKA